LARTFIYRRWTVMGKPWLVRSTKMGLGLTGWPGINRS
jgi:hypothetical protein